jgi:hypothetical protein
MLLAPDVYAPRDAPRDTRLSVCPPAFLSFASSILARLSLPVYPCPSILNRLSALPVFLPCPSVRLVCPLHLRDGQSVRPSFLLPCFAPLAVQDPAPGPSRALPRLGPGYK